jgi:RNA polymerase sigma factor (sigma-70 family)
MSPNRGLALVEPKKTTDEQLFRTYATCRNGADDADAITAFEIVFDKYFNRLHAYFMAKGASPDHAEDLAQDVFVRVTRAALTFDMSRGTFRAWLFKTAANVFTDFLRVKGNMQLIPLEECEGALRYVPGQVMQLDKYLRELEPKLRDPLELSVLGGLTAPEIADVLGVAEGTVYSRIHRAKAKLRRKLDPHSKVKRVPKKAFPKQESVKQALPPMAEIQATLPYREDQQ